MKIGEICLNAELTPITFINNGQNFDSFQPIFENKVCDSSVMNYTKSRAYPSTDIPAIVQSIYSTTIDRITISALFEININNSMYINVHAKKIKAKKTIRYAKNKLSNYINTKIVEHFIIHDITNYNKRIFNMYTELHKKLL